MKWDATMLYGIKGMKIKSHSLILACSMVIFCGSFAHAAQEGTQAPGFSLRDLKGDAITLEQFRGKVVFLAFWAPWCIPCRDEFPALDSLYKKFQNEGFIVVGIAVDASTEGVAKFLRKAPVSFPVLIDSNSTVAESYRLINMPTAYIIGRDGIVRYRHLGYGKELLLQYEKEISELVKQ
jgi:peroxiredoxin